MADREKLIELIDEAEEHSIDICVYNSDCKDCPGRKYGNKCREYLKADHLISHGVTVRERGRWKKTYTCHGERLWGYECNQCKADNPRASYFCPNCGADMRGEEDA